MKKYSVTAFCAMCTLNTVYKALDLSTSDEGLKLKIMQRVLNVMSENFSESTNPTFLANKIFPVINKMSGNPDPYKAIKDKSNEIAKKIVAEIKSHVFEPSNFDSRLLRGIAAAITGNVIDYGNAFHKVNFDELKFIYFDILKRGFAINHIDKLKLLINNAKEILYFGDNAGEVFFDRLLIEILKEKIDKVYFVVKGGPIINDATLDDALAAKIDEVAEILTTGKPKLGIDLTDISNEVKSLLDSVDFAIFKGQANFETVNYQLEQIKIPKVNIFRAKCKPISEFLGVPLGSNIVIVQ